MRNANTGELTGSTTSNQAGQFSFAGLQPGNYVVEIVDAGGKGRRAEPIARRGRPVDRDADGSRDGAVWPRRAAAVSACWASAPWRAWRLPRGATAAVTAVVATREGRIVVCHRENGASQTLEISENVPRDKHSDMATRSARARPARASKHLEFHRQPAAAPARGRTPPATW